jgi:hypothetical protein
MIPVNVSNIIMKTNSLSLSVQMFCQNLYWRRLWPWICGSLLDPYLGFWGSWWGIRQGAANNGWGLLLG